MFVRKFNRIHFITFMIFLTNIHFLCLVDAHVKCTSCLGFSPCSISNFHKDVLSTRGQCIVGLGPAHTQHIMLNTGVQV